MTNAEKDPPALKVDCQLNHITHLSVKAYHTLSRINGIGYSGLEGSYDKDDFAPLVNGIYFEGGKMFNVEDRFGKINFALLVDGMYFKEKKYSIWKAALANIT